MPSAGAQYSASPHWTDDLRESPVLEMMERLLGKGFDLRVYDRSVNLAKLVGANREYLLEHIPHISRLMCARPEEVLEHAGTLVIGSNDPEFRTLLPELRADQVVVDLVRIVASPPEGASYHGICW